MDIPTTPFFGYLRCIRGEDLNESGRAVFDKAFPWFLDKRSDAEIAAEMEFATLHRLDGLLLESRPRRFSGDDSLRRGRYFSVANDIGEDSGTLLRELLAYSRPESTATYWGVDLAWPDQMAVMGFLGLPPRNAIAVFPLSMLVRDRTTPQLHWSLSRALQRILSWAKRNEEMKTESTCTHDISGEDYITILPARTEFVAIENCLDLRVPKAQMWLFETFKLGVRNKYLRPNGHNAQNFFHLLPSMMWPQIGGGDVESPGSFNRVLGTVLREEGVDALIYPSARSNVGIQISNGKIDKWYGWNLVDYRNAPLPALSKIYSNLFVDRTPWTDFPYPVQITIARGTADSDGSWKVNGIEKPQLATFDKVMRGKACRD